MSGAIIVALATPAGRSGVAVLRLSGPSLQALAHALTGLLLLPRHAHLTSFRDVQGEVLDRGLLLWFPGPHSYTGEDVLELHTHGGDVLPQRVLQACLALGARLAEPGEFTRRAFEHGKLDLTQAEAVADLIEAGSEAAARAALRSLSGDFSREIIVLRGLLETLRIQLEGAIDFPEESLDLVTRPVAQELIAPQLEVIDRLLEQGARSQVLRAGCRVVLLGAPNAGKSSLLNRLAGDALALVSAVPGTTRDAVRTQLELAGVRLELIDTAGLRSTEDLVENLGIARSREVAAQADLILHVHAVAPAEQGIPTIRDHELTEALGHIPRIVVWNKIDLLSSSQRAMLMEQYPQACCVSAQSGDGLETLETRILSLVGRQANLEPPFLARSRHLHALQQTRLHLEAAQQAAADEFMAEELRLAQRALDDIVGRTLPDQLLGEIFSRFCIGK